MRAISLTIIIFTNKPYLPMEVRCTPELCMGQAYLSQAFTANEPLGFSPFRISGLHP
jgi:hypothetical protein